MIHKITQEQEDLPESDGEWFLVTMVDTDRVYAANSAGHPSIWMTRHLRTSVWSIGDRVLVYQRSGTDGQPESKRWLSEVSRLHKVDWVDIEVRDGDYFLGRTSAKVYMLDTARDGAMVFWEADAFKDIVGKQVKSAAEWFKDSFRKSWWPWLMSQGVPESHMLRGQRGQRSVLTECFAVHRHAISTWALLMLIRKWATSLDSGEGRRRAICLFGTMTAMVPSSFKFDYKCIRGPVSIVDEYVEATVVGGKLLPLSGLHGAIGADDREQGWPYSDVTLLLAASSLAFANLTAAHEFCRGMAKVVDHVVVSRHSQPSDIIAKILRQSRFFIDPDVKSMMYKVGRSGFRTSKLCKSLQLRLAGNAYRQQTLDRTKYWLALREEMTSGCTFASSVDATRFSGKDWQCGPICNVGSQKFGWMAPVAFLIFVITIEL